MTGAGRARGLRGKGFVIRRLDTSGWSELHAKVTFLMVWARVLGAVSGKAIAPTSPYLQPIMTTFRWTHSSSCCHCTCFIATFAAADAIEQLNVILFKRAKRAWYALEELDLQGLQLLQAWMPLQELIWPQSIHPLQCCKQTFNIICHMSMAHSWNC